MINNKTSELSKYLFLFGKNKSALKQKIIEKKHKANFKRKHNYKFIVILVYSQDKM